VVISGGARHCAGAAASSATRSVFYTDTEDVMGSGHVSTDGFKTLIVDPPCRASRRMSAIGGDVDAFLIRTSAGEIDRATFALDAHTGGPKRARGLRTIDRAPPVRCSRSHGARYAGSAQFVVRSSALRDGEFLERKATAQAGD